MKSFALQAIAHPLIYVEASPQRELYCFELAVLDSHFPVRIHNAKLKNLSTPVCAASSTYIVSPDGKFPCILKIIFF
jgi:hypothetical protein